MRDLRNSLEGKWAGPVALAIVHAILAALSFHQAPFTGGDDATYLSLAKSLIERHDYTDIWNPLLPPHTQYPPIFPIVVAAGLMAGLAPLVGMKILMIFISTGAVFASCVWLRRVTTAGVAFTAGFFIAISPEVIWLGQEVLSDHLFWLFSILALIAWRQADRTSAGGEVQQMTAGSVLIATAATLAAYFTRSAGAPLLLAVFIWLVYRKQYRAVALVAAMAAPFIFAWWLRGHSHGAGGYLAPFLSVDPYNPAAGTVTPAILLERVAKNATVYGSRHLSRLVFGSLRTGLIFGSAFAALMIYGWARRLRKPGLPEIWLPIYLALVILWPVTWAGARFLFPVVPLLALYVGESIAGIAKYASHPRIFAAAILVAGVVTVQPGLKRQITIGSACRARYSEGEKFPCIEPVFADFFTIAESSRGKLPPNSVVLSRKPTIFFLHSGYRSTLYPLSPVPDSLFNLAKRVAAQYVVIDQISDLAPRYLHPIMLERRDDFCIIPELALKNAAMAKIEVGGPRRPDAAENSFRACPLDSVRQAALP
jgi:hypothetical protein